MNLRFDGLSEFISRAARVKLVRMLLAEGLTQLELAAKLGVSQQAVSKWLDPSETHPCNTNLDALLHLALRTNRPRVLKILEDELKTFRRLLTTLKT